MLEPSAPPTPADEGRCPYCGSPVRAEARFCTSCGSSLRDSTPAPAAGAESSPAPSGVGNPPGQPAAPARAARASGGKSRCAMIVGYLVPHHCDNPALGRCAKCGRGFCDEHLSITAGGMICLACEQGLEQPVALPLTASTYSSGDIVMFDTMSRWDDDDADTFADLS